MLQQLKETTLSLGDKLMVVLLIEYIALASIYAIEFNWTKAVYWTGAAIITSSVLFMK